jgi:hypothetical protein
MQQIIINIEDDSKAKYFIDFLKQIDFINIDRIQSQKKISNMQNEITESCSDLKNGKTKSWNNKKIVLKDA